MIANVYAAMNPSRVDPMEAILVSDDDEDVRIVGGSNFSDEDDADE